MRHLTAAVIAGVLALPLQPSPVTISGRVVADETGEPIRNARIGVTPAANGPSVGLTDADGRFTFSVPSGRVTISASKSGYAKAEATATAGADAIEIRLHRGAAISGRVVDEFGDPVLASHVMAQAAGSAANAAPVASTDTDDRGEYRLAGLPAGSFVVLIAIAPGPTVLPAGATIPAARPAPQRTFYPGVATPAEAQVLQVRSGEDRPGIDFVLSAEQSAGQPLGIIVLGPMARAPARDPSAKAGTIRGRVVSTDGRSLSHAQVHMFSMADLRMQLTGRADGDGQFEFGDLPAGKFQITASKNGYTLDPPSEPATAPRFPVLGVSVDVGEGGTRDRVEVRLRPWGSLGGRVFDENGDPLQGASVRVLVVGYERGRKRLVPAGVGARLTDDLGRYRLHSIGPGQYIVSASVGDVASADLPGYTRGYFPGTATPGEAQFVSVNVGQDTTGIDFSLSRVRTARVAGKLLNAAGEPTSGGSLQLAPSSTSSAVTSVPVGARILPDGRFEFANVPPGQYVIRADRGRLTTWAEGEFGTMLVAVSGTDVTDLTVQTSSGSAIKGRFVFDANDASKMPAASAIEFSPMPFDFDLAPGNTAIAEIRADWSFELAGINGPRRLQLSRVPDGWTLQEVRVRGIDVTDRVRPFGRAEQSLSDVEVVMTDRVSELSGVITDDHGQPTPGVHVIVFSTARDRWYPASRFLRKAMAGTGGAFTVAGLPFGTYYAAAIAKLPVEGDDAWQDVAFLETLVSRAPTVTVRDGQKQSVMLSVPATVK